MKKLFLFSLVVALAASILFTSCKKDNAVGSNDNVAPVNESAKLKNVKEENGILIFNSKADFDNALTVVEKNQSTISQWLYPQFPNFISSSKAFDALTELDYENIAKTDVAPAQYQNFAMKVVKARENYVIPVVSATILSYVVNKDGLVGYGDKVFKIAYDNWYEFDKSQLPNYLQSNGQLTRVQNVKTNSVKHSILYEKEVMDVAPRWNVTYFDMVLYNGARKFSGVISSTVYSGGNPDPNDAIIGSYIDATSKFQRSRWYGWTVDEAEILSTDGYVVINGRSSDPNNPNRIDVTGSARNTGCVSFGGRALDGIATILGYNTTHKCKDYNGNNWIGWLQK